MFGKLNIKGTFEALRVVCRIFIRMPASACILPELFVEVVTGGFVPCGLAKYHAGCLESVMCRQNYM